MPLSGENREVIEHMAWPQFVRLLEELDMEDAVFVEADPPNARSLRFDRQMVVLGVSDEHVSEAIRRLFRWKQAATLLPADCSGVCRWSPENVRSTITAFTKIMEKMNIAP